MKILAISILSFLALNAASYAQDDAAETVQVAETNGGKQAGEDEEQTLQDDAGLDDAGQEEADGTLQALDDLVWAPAGPGDPQFRLLKRYITVQCALARRACDLNDDQRSKLAALDDRWIASEIRRVTQQRQAQVGLLQGVVRLLGGRQVQQQQRDVPPKEVVARVREATDQKILECLKEAQATAFGLEVQARLRFRSEALAAILVSAFDHHLFLSEEQRESLTKSIAHWLEDTKTDLYWQFYLQNNNTFIPMVPRAILAEHLDKSQLDALQGLQQYNYESADIELQVAQHEGAVFLAE